LADEFYVGLRQKRPNDEEVKKKKDIYWNRKILIVVYFSFIKP
jgi:capsule polysaccharide export protein KpsE/RkpR